MILGVGGTLNTSKQRLLQNFDKENGEKRFKQLAHVINFCVIGAAIPRKICYLSWGESDAV